MVNGASGVDLGLEFAGYVGELSAREDVEIVVGGVATSMAFSTNCGAWCGIRMVLREGHWD